jgi:L,D-peptidoglycan transpeptidase YkuD (ErfK/YbiS/YcfS/YnhG family)
MAWCVRAGRLETGSASYPVIAGRGGMVDLWSKREGDGASPVGRYPLRRVFYREDRLGRAPRTGLPAKPIAPDDGWCDDPASPDYNSWVRLPHRASHERLWRADERYDLILVIGHNDAPVVPGRGSAVFVHVAGEGQSVTEGCVALARDHLLALLAEATLQTTLSIGQP